MFSSSFNVVCSARIDYLIVDFIFAIFEASSCMVLAMPSKIQPRISFLDSHLPSLWSFDIDVPSGKMLSMPGRSARVVCGSSFADVSWNTDVKSSKHASMSWRKASVSSSHAFTVGVSDGIIISSRSCGSKEGSDSNCSHTSLAISLPVQKIEHAFYSSHWCAM